MKILVTGGAGFIASHIVDAYIKLGHSLIVIDNLYTGSKKNVNPKARFYRGDLKNRAFVFNVIGKEKPDIINHHAALASLRVATDEPEKLIDSNISGTMNVLLATKNNSIKKFIFASSCSVLGHPKKLPANEETPINPLSPYAFTKLANEIMIQFYAQWHKFPYVIFRYPNIYGPRQNPKSEAGIIPIFASLLRKDERPTIFGDGSKTRDYVYVTDCVDANIAALTKGKNTILNLGWGKEISDEEISEKVRNNIGSKLAPKYTPFRDWESKHISLNATKAKKILNWSPKISIDVGMKKTIDSLTK